MPTSTPGRSSSDRSAVVAQMFDGQRLELIRNLRQLTKADLARSLGKSATAVGYWESGAKKPSAAAVAELSLLLQTSPESFLAGPRGDSGNVSGAHFRSLRSTTRQDRLSAEAFGSFTADIIATMDKFVAFPEPDVPEFPVGDAASTTEPDDAAALVRAYWACDPGPIRHVVRLLENKGIFVVAGPPQSKKVDAYSLELGSRDLVVLNTQKDDYYRQRFDCAHELGHLVMHRGIESGGRQVEDESNRFAAAFLAPARDIREELPSQARSADWVRMSRLKERWGMSLQALLFRSRYLQVMPETNYRNAMMQISRRGWRTAEPGAISVPEQPSLLPAALEILEKEGLKNAEILGQCRAPADTFQQAVSRDALAG